LRAHENEFRLRHVGIAAVGLGDQQYAREFRQETGIDFPLLIDGDRKAYSAIELKTANILHLFKPENSVARQRAKAHGQHQYKMGKNPFQLGGTFIFAPGEVDLFNHISQTFGDNVPMTELLRALP